MYPEAAARFRRIAELQPSWQSQYNLALALVKAKQSKEALPLLASLTAEHATDANLLSDIASTYESAGENSLALRVRLGESDAVTEAIKQLESGDLELVRLFGDVKTPASVPALLQLATTTTMSPAEIHKLGVEQGAEISSRIDALMKSQGITQGTVGQRFKALYDDPKSFFPSTDAGVADAVAFCNAQIDKIRPALPRVFKRLPPYTFEIRRVPKEIEPGAPSVRVGRAAVEFGRRRLLP